jgi:hypothetical protein
MCEKESSGSVDAKTSRIKRVTEPTPGSGPREGDIVVTRESKSAVAFTIRQFPGTVQLSSSSREEALRLARGLAARTAVDLWYCENAAYKLLEAYRRRD